jgi:hypothetical protein
MMVTTNIWLQAGVKAHLQHWNGEMSIARATKPPQREPSTQSAIAQHKTSKNSLGGQKNESTPNQDGRTAPKLGKPKPKFIVRKEKLFDPASA